MEISGTIVLLAIIVEQVTSIIKGAVPVIRGSRAQSMSIAVGIILCWSTKSGVLQELSVPTVYPIVDYILTGLLISRGSNFVHDALQSMSRYMKKRG